jgi:hypothetical protein
MIDDELERTRVESLYESIKVRRDGDDTYILLEGKELLVGGAKFRHLLEQAVKIDSRYVKIGDKRNIEDWTQNRIGLTFPAFELTNVVYGKPIEVKMEEE